MKGAGAGWTSNTKVMLPNWTADKHFQEQVLAERLIITRCSSAVRPIPVFTFLAFTQHHEDKSFHSSFYPWMWYKDGKRSLEEAEVLGGQWTLTLYAEVASPDLYRNMWTLL